MKRLVLTAGIAVAAAVPAALGLIGNASFAQSVPVHVPERATLLDDRGSAIPTTLTVTADDHGGLRSSLSSSAPSTRTPASTASPVTATSDDGHHGAASGHDGSGDPVATTVQRSEAGDDHGGLRSAPESEPGDDKGGLRSTGDAAPTEANSGSSADASVGQGGSNNDSSGTSSRSDDGSGQHSGSDKAGSDSRGGDDGAGHS